MAGRLGIVLFAIGQAYRPGAGKGVMEEIKYTTALPLGQG
jgi:hypothetical protein